MDNKTANRRNKKYISHLKWIRTVEFGSTWWCNAVAHVILFGVHPPWWAFNRCTILIFDPLLVRVCISVLAMVTATTIWWWRQRQIGNCRRFMCVGTYSVFALLAGIAISRWYYCHTLVSLGYFMRLPNNWIFTVIRSIEIHTFGFFIPLLLSWMLMSSNVEVSACHALNASPKCFHSISSCLMDERARACAWPISASIVCLYFQFLHECNRLLVIRRDLLRNIRARSCDCMLIRKNWIDKENKLEWIARQRVSQQANEPEWCGKL